MEESKRESVINFDDIKLFSSYGEIEGHISASIVSENETLYFVTDLGYFYIQEQGKEKISHLLMPLVQQNAEKYQTEEVPSFIWSDNLGHHTIICNNKRVFYYNPSLSKDGPKELDLEYKNQNSKKSYYIEPYAVGFNNNVIITPNNRNTVEVLVSDYYSNIYTLKITLERGIPKVEIELVYKLNEEYI